MGKRTQKHISAAFISLIFKYVQGQTVAQVDGRAQGTVPSIILQVWKCVFHLESLQGKE